MNDRSSPQLEKCGPYLPNPKSLDGSLLHYISIMDRLYLHLIYKEGLSFQFIVYI